MLKVLIQLFLVVRRGITGFTTRGLGRGGGLVGLATVQLAGHDICEDER